MSEQLIKTPIEAEAENSVMGMLRKYSGNFKGVLPAHLTAKRCGQLVLNSIAANPKLAECTPLSFINAVILSANMGLEIRKNSCYLIPYGKECTLVVDYHGKMELARRAGVGSIHCELVREGDVFDYGFDRQGLVFNWRPGKDRGEITHVFVSAKVNGDNQINIMSLDEIESIRRRAKSGAAMDWQHYGRPVKGVTLAQIRDMDVVTMDFRSPYRLPWVTDYDRMARKTAIHRAANDWPQSAALLVSQEVDDAVDMGKPMPTAEGMEEIVKLIDPADNRPMVDGGGDNYAEQKASAAAVGAEQLAKAEARRSGPPITKGQCDKIAEAAAKAKLLPSDTLMRNILSKHWASNIPDVRQSDFDSVMAAIEEAAR